MGAPYLGAETFGFEHRALFHGRAEEGRSVASMIAVHPLAVLTGASGTGKSSLLAAMVLPTLSARGWLPVMAQPAEDPRAAIRRELLAQAVPDRAAERAALETLAGLLPGPDPWSMRLSEAQRWYGGLGAADPHRPLLDRAGLSEADKVARVTLLVRLLAGAVPAGAGYAQLAAIAGLDAPRADPTLGELRDALATPARLDPGRAFGGGEPCLGRLCLAVWRRWLKPQGWKGLVLVLDQAEELYTRFGRSGVGRGLRVASGAGEWQRRDAFFAELPLFAAVSRRHPLRLCFSLRPEWFSNLIASLGRLAPADPGALHLLQPMRRDQAEAALLRPAELQGVTVTPAAAAVILSQLEAEGEGGGIDPFLLAMLSRLAWEFATERAAPRAVESAVTAAAPSEVTAAAATLALTLRDLVALRRGPSPLPARRRLLDGALAWWIERRLAGAAEDQRFDMLELLSLLVTEEGTRRILPEAELLARPLRHRGMVADAIDALDRARLIRRSGGAAPLCEVRHERLIPVVAARLEAERQAELGELGAAQRHRARLADAIALLVADSRKRLDTLLAGGLREDPLPGWARDSLVANRAAVAWDPPAARTVLASLLFRGATGGADRAARREWLRLAMGDLLPGLSRPIPGAAVAGGIPVPRAVAALLRRGQSPGQVAAALRGGPATHEERVAVWRWMLAKGARERGEVREWTRWALRRSG